MAITSGLFNSINGDRRYDAKWFALYFATFIGNGVFPNPSTGLQVTEDSNMRTVVKAGQGWINGYFIVNDGDYVLQHDVADGVLKRIDRVVMRLNYLSREIEIDIKKGTFASTPVAPSIQRDADAYELALADVLINNGATVITQANITDQRLNSSLCGIVHGTVDQVDTTTIFNQYQAWFNDITSGTEQEIADWQQQQYDDFMIWFQSIQDILEGDVAANLASRISNLENDFTTHLAERATLTEEGHVRLSNATDSTSNTLAATPSAVKSAMDRANEAFLLGNSTKEELVDALLLLDPSLPISYNSTWQEIMAATGQISTGKKWASGEVALVTGTFGISGLDFKPSKIFYYLKNYTGINYAIGVAVDSGDIYGVDAGPFNNVYMNSKPGLDYNVRRDKTTTFEQGSVSNLMVDTSTQGNYIWHAFE